MMSDVFFTDLRAFMERDNVQNKLARMFKRAKFGEIVTKGDLVAIKTHFGEMGNTAFLRPQFISKIVDLVVAVGGRPFLTDSNTLYVGSRSNAVDHLWTAARHGFVYPSVNAPVIIADGLKGKEEVEVEVGLKRCRTVKVGAAAMHADSVICVSHYKGHIATGFGGAMKNLGMGFGSRAGKLEMHCGMGPEVNKGRCRGCGYCVPRCPGKAIEIIDGKAHIDKGACIGCGECVVICLHQAMEAKDWSSDNMALQEKIVEYCYGIMRGRHEKFGFVTFVMDVVPYCDCAPWNDVSVVPDIGILMSKDIVAIDQAACDLVNAQQGPEGTALEKGRGRGEDKVKALTNINWEHQLEYAEELGLGKREYRLVTVK
ncbi:MAG: DUF362 domain-containing protein [Methanomassiliicoccales archaeon]|nr:MAG: DUF362 domain-containing protein [Methanomassiliicoccales archaeon]